MIMECCDKTWQSSGGDSAVEVPVSGGGRKVVSRWVVLKKLIFFGVRGRCSHTSLQLVGEVMSQSEFVDLITKINW